MRVRICEDAAQMGAEAAVDGAELIRAAIAKQDCANVIFATGASQFTVLSSLVAQPDIAWDRVTGFHLDEYVDLPETHPASFRRYLRERLVEKVPFAKFAYVDGEGDAGQTCDAMGKLIAEHPIDVAFIGIGENGHLAFNDPPADFETEQPYLVVELDEACRRQQLGEGWFPTLDDVPTRAISMSIRQIMKSEVIVCSVPDRRKAEAVKNAIEGPVTNQVPASILQRHANATIYLDQPAASLLSEGTPQK